MEKKEINTFYGEHLDYGLTITLRYPKKDTEKVDWFAKYQEFIRSFLGIIEPESFFLQFSYSKRDILDDGSIQEDFIWEDDASGFELSASEILNLDNESILKLIPGSHEVFANFMFDEGNSRLVVPARSLLLSGEKHEYTYPSEDYGDDMGYILEDGEGRLIESYSIKSHPSGTLDYIEAEIELGNTVFWENDYISKKIIHCLNSLTDRGWKIKSLPDDIADLLNQ